MLGNKKDKNPEISILTLKNSVLFPGTVVPLLIGREKSMRLIEEAIKNNSYIGVIAQTDPEMEEPGIQDLYTVGTLAKIIKFSKDSDGHYNVMIEGVKRFLVTEFKQEEPYFTAEVQNTPPEAEGIINPGGRGGGG